MLPRSTHTRSKRDPGGRGKEIQRLIGRALRAAVDLRVGECTLTVDYVVVTAAPVTSITGRGSRWAGAAPPGGQAISPTRRPMPPVAAVSVGIVDGEVVLDLPYVEDSRADVDMNVV
jgi:ribonuclease PH